MSAALIESTERAPGLPVDPVLAASRGVASDLLRTGPVLAILGRIRDDYERDVASLMISGLIRQAYIHGYDAGLSAEHER